MQHNHSNVLLITNFSTMYELIFETILRRIYTQAHRHNQQLYGSCIQTYIYIHIYVYIYIYINLIRRGKRINKPYQKKQKNIMYCTANLLNRIKSQKQKN